MRVHSSKQTQTYSHIHEYKPIVCARCKCISLHTYIEIQVALCICLRMPAICWALVAFSLFTSLSSSSQTHIHTRTPVTTSFQCLLVIALMLLPPLGNINKYLLYMRCANIYIYTNIHTHTNSEMKKKRRNEIKLEEQESL